MTPSSLPSWLAARRAADEEVCQCGRKRESHFERVGACDASGCGSFQRADVVIEERAVLV